MHFFIHTPKILHRTKFTHLTNWKMICLGINSTNWYKNFTIRTFCIISKKTNFPNSFNKINLSVYH